MVGWQARMFSKQLSHTISSYVQLMHIFTLACAACAVSSPTPGRLLVGTARVAKRQRRRVTARMMSRARCHRPVLTLQPAGSGVRVLVPDQPPLRAAPAEVPQHPQQLDEHQRDEVGEQVALADAHGVDGPGEGEQQPGQEEVDAVLAAEDLGVLLRVAAARGGGTAAFLHLPRRRPAAAGRRPRFPRGAPRPSAGGPSPIGDRGAERGRRGQPLPAGGWWWWGGVPGCRGRAPQGRVGFEGWGLGRLCGAGEGGLPQSQPPARVEAGVGEKLFGGGPVGRRPCPPRRGAGGLPWGTRSCRPAGRAGHGP